MPKPLNHEASGGRLTGDIMRDYTEIYAEKFLSNRIRYRTLVGNIRRGDGGWKVAVTNLDTKLTEDLHFDKLVLCSGVKSPINVFLCNLTQASSGLQSASYPIRTEQIALVFQRARNTFQRFRGSEGEPFIGRFGYGYRAKW